MKDVERVRRKPRYQNPRFVAVANDPPKHWIAGATKHPGALRKTLHMKEGQKIPMAKLEKAAHMGGKTGKRDRLAMTLKKMH
jgi:hypothetical protein